MRSAEEPACFRPRRFQWPILAQSQNQSQSQSQADRPIIDEKRRQDTNNHIDTHDELKTAPNDDKPQYQR